MNTQSFITVDGRPFFVLGGQVHNSSANTMRDMEPAWRALELMHANTAEVPVYWEQVEPVEGAFDFSLVDGLIDAARQRGLRLVLLWFATWKNGMMKYAPSWVKADSERFRRVVNPAGHAIAVLSSHCEATRAADARAFCALLAHLREVDSARRTVIAVQVENEPGILGSDRDYGPAAEAEFNAPVPVALLAAIAAAPTSATYRAWQAQGAPAAGLWPEVFGAAAGEYLSAWSIARYIDAIAVAGKAVYDIPLYVNAWLGEMGWRVAGESYPSGGPTASALEIWKWAAPHIDLLAPDIYIEDHQGFKELCDIYGRPDNPLFVPESMPGPSNALNIFHAIAKGAVGYAVFGIESLLTPAGEPTPERGQMVIDSFRCVAAALPLIERRQGPIVALVQEEYRNWQYLDLGDLVAVGRFASAQGGFFWKDFRHFGRPAERGRGLLFRVSEREFYLVGAGLSLLFRRKSEPRASLLAPDVSEFLASRLSNYILVEEGHFAGDEWVVDRRRNGDESDHGVWVEPDCGVVRVVLDM